MGRTPGGIRAKVSCASRVPTDCWTVGLLDCWTVGLLDCWTGGLVDWWTGGLVAWWQRASERASSERSFSERFAVGGWAESPCGVFRGWAGGTGSDDSLIEAIGLAFWRWILSFAPAGCCEVQYTNC